MKKYKPTGEREVFAKVWATRPHTCEVSGRYIPEPKTYCFAHQCNKGLYPERRLDPNNISLVYGLKEHAEIDRVCAGKKEIIIRE